MFLKTMINKSLSKSKKGISSFIKRKDRLPHWQTPAVVYFITFVTHKRQILRPEERSIVLEALEYWNLGDVEVELNADIYSFSSIVKRDKIPRWSLVTAVVMHDHVHAMIRPLEKSPGLFWDLSEIMHTVKSFTARKINKLNKRIGVQVWQTETFDRIIRDHQEFDYTLQYIAWNPIKAGLASNTGYPWFMLRNDIRESGWVLTPLEIMERLLWDDPRKVPDFLEKND
jgi:putative transposase